MQTNEIRLKIYYSDSYSPEYNKSTYLLYFRNLGFFKADVDRLDCVIEKPIVEPISDSNIDAYAVSKGFIHIIDTPNDMSQIKFYNMSNIITKVMEDLPYIKKAFNETLHRNGVLVMTKSEIVMCSMINRLVNVITGK